MSAVGDRSCDRWHCIGKTRTDNLVCKDAFVKQFARSPRAGQ